MAWRACGIGREEKKAENQQNRERQKDQYFSLRLASLQ